MEHSPLVCPICGAPYRQVIPVGAAQVKCRYCGGTVLVPARLPRCPNHPDTVAVSICNDCGHSYCNGCLSNYALKGESESGYLHLCPNCLQQRYLGSANNYVLSGLACLVFGFLVFLANQAVGVLLIVFVAVPAIVYGSFKRRLYRGNMIAYIERRRAAAEEKSQRTSQEIYRDMLIEYSKSFGPVRGAIILENQVEYYLKSGLTREEAVRELAKNEGYT